MTTSTGETHTRQQDDAVFTFAVGYTSHRPVRPDEHTAFVTLAEEDSLAGLARARHLAADLVMCHGGPWMLHRHHPVAMVTRIELVGVEL